MSPNEQKILSIILEKGVIQSSALYAEMVKLGEDVSLVTVKRALSQMASAGVLILSGSGRSTSYDVSATGRINAQVDPHKYFSI